MKTRVRPSQEEYETLLKNLEEELRHRDWDNYIRALKALAFVKDLIEKNGGKFTLQVGTNNCSPDFGVIHSKYPAIGEIKRSLPKINYSDSETTSEDGKIKKIRDQIKKYLTSEEILVDSLSPKYLLFLYPGEARDTLRLVLDDLENALHSESAQVKRLLSIYKFEKAERESRSEIVVSLLNISALNTKESTTLSEILDKYPLLYENIRGYGEEIPIFDEFRRSESEFLPLGIYEADQPPPYTYLFYLVLNILLPLLVQEKIGLEKLGTNKIAVRFKPRELLERIKKLNILLDERALTKSSFQKRFSLVVRALADMGYLRLLSSIDSTGRTADWLDWEYEIAQKDILGKKKFSRRFKQNKKKG